MSFSTLWRGQLPPKEETTNSKLSAMDELSLTTIGIFGLTDRRKMMMVNLDRLATYQRAARDDRPQEGSSGGGCRVNTAKSRATGRKVRPSTDVASTALGKEDMVVCL
jgi:hypothetical protein